MPFFNTGTGKTKQRIKSEIAVRYQADSGDRYEHTSIQTIFFSVAKK